MYHVYTSWYVAIYRIIYCILYASCICSILYPRWQLGLYYNKIYTGMYDVETCCIMYTPAGMLRHTLSYIVYCMMWRYAVSCIHQLVCGMVQRYTGMYHIEIYSISVSYIDILCDIEIFCII